MRKLIPNSKLVIFDNCGHLPHHEKLDDFISELTAHTLGTEK